MLRGTSSRGKREEHTASALAPSLNTSSNVSGRYGSNSHSVSRPGQHQFSCSSKSNQLQFLHNTKATVHTPIHFSAIVYNYFHTSKRLLDETSSSSVHGQGLPQEQLASNSSVNFVQLDQQTHDTASTQVTIGIESVEVSSPQSKETPPAVSSGVDAETHFRTGYELSQKGKHKEAVKAFKAAIKIDTTHSTAHHWLGLSYSSFGQHSRAIIHFQRSLATSTDNKQLTLDTYNSLGQSYIAKQMFQESVDVMDKIIVIDHTNKLAHYNRGYALMMLEIFTFANKCFDITLRIDAKHLGSLQCKAYCLIMQRQFEKAIEFIKAAEETYPVDPTLHHYKEHAYKKYFKQRGVYSLNEILTAQLNRDSISRPSHRSSSRLFEDDD